uniref:Nip1a n=1 Tax=Arundo donax TaxID=35708 RepID=A0A0A9ER76_ARUDO
MEVTTRGPWRRAGRRSTLTRAAPRPSLFPSSRRSSLRSSGPTS